MTYVAGLYGIQITRPIKVWGLTFEPITNDHQQAEKLARDLDIYHLTATVSGESLDPELCSKLEAVLSFIEHLDVLVSIPIQRIAVDESVTTLFPKSLATQRRNSSGGGAVVGVDTFFPDSRAKFIELALQHLSDDAFCNSTKFNSLFFKCVETFRQRRPFLDISYFLLYSGLESYARAAVRGDRISKNSSEPIYQLLESYGFKVHLEKPSELSRAISTYTHLRNAIFHNSEYQATIPMNGLQVQLNITEYFYNLSMLVSLTIMKAIQFDDGHINWDAWIDRQLFK